MCQRSKHIKIKLYNIFLYTKTFLLYAFFQTTALPRDCEVVKKFNFKFLSTLIGRNDKTINLCFRSETLILVSKPIADNSNPSIHSATARTLTRPGSKPLHTPHLPPEGFTYINLSHLNIKLCGWIIRLYVVFMMKHYSRHYSLIKY